MDPSLAAKLALLPPRHRALLLSLYGSPSWPRGRVNKTTAVRDGYWTSSLHAKEVLQVLHSRGFLQHAGQGDFVPLPDAEVRRAILEACGA